MTTEILGVILIIAVTFLLAIPLGKYISKVFKEEKVWTDFLAPFEKFIFKIFYIFFLNAQAIVFNRNLKE